MRTGNSEIVYWFYQFGWFEDFVTIWNVSLKLKISHCLSLSLFLLVSVSVSLSLCLFLHFSLSLFLSLCPTLKSALKATTIEFIKFKCQNTNCFSKKRLSSNQDKAKNSHRSYTIKNVNKQHDCPCNRHNPLKLQFVVCIVWQKPNQTKWKSLSK